MRGGVHARGVCAGGVLVMYSQYGPSVFGIYAGNFQQLELQSG